jgi:FtsP/CotA-like multicopper oxidase with cupredoxin domain
MFISPAAVRASEAAGLERFVDPLAVPAYVDGTAAVGLTMVNAKHRFHGGLGDAATLTYRLSSGRVIADGSPPLRGYLGPTIVVPTGHPTTVKVTNRIVEHPLARSVDTNLHGVSRRDAERPRTSTHLHGGNTAPEHDGGPLDTFRDSHTYHYENEQDATGLWYHDHALGITRLNVHAGLAGGYLIRDTAESGIDTGSGKHLPPPPYEIPLVIQDRTFRPAGALFYEPAPWAPEFFGDTAVVNGVAQPYLRVARGMYRFRLVNGSNARFFRLSLRVRGTGDRLPFFQIGGDGGLFNRPVPLRRLLIAPGERADLLVDFRDLRVGARVEMHNHAVVPFPSGEEATEDSRPLRQVMQFRVTAARGWRPRNPISGMDLRPVTKVTRLDRVAASARVRTHSLVEILTEDDEVVMGTLNNRTFHSMDFAEKDAPVSPNSVEVWEFANTTMDAHPIHLHLVQFQVLNRQPFDGDDYLEAHYVGANGRIRPNTGPYPAPSPRRFLNGRVHPPRANELGWKDTVIAPPGMVTRVVVPFGRGAVKAPIASRKVYSGDYVWHCHILEHEDNDMMQRYRIG